MPIEHILTLLISERDKLNRAIEALGAPVKRRGRPAKSSGTSTPLGTQEVAQHNLPSKPRRRIFTAAQRKRQADRMRAFWAAKRSAASKPIIAATIPARQRTPMTAAQKKALSVKMKAAWARRKAGKG